MVFMKRNSTTDDCDSTKDGKLNHGGLDAKVDGKRVGDPNGNQPCEDFSGHESGLVEDRPALESRPHKDNSIDSGAGGTSRAYDGIRTRNTTQDQHRTNGSATCRSYTNSLTRGAKKPETDHEPLTKHSRKGGHEVNRTRIKARPSQPFSTLSCCEGHFIYRAVTPPTGRGVPRMNKHNPVPLLTLYLNSVCCWEISGATPRQLSAWLSMQIVAGWLYLWVIWYNG